MLADIRLQPRRVHLQQNFLPVPLYRHLVLRPHIGHVADRAALALLAAIAQGEIAGANMAGDEQSYQPPVSSLAFNEVGLSLFSAGSVNQPNASRLVWDDRQNNIYRLLVFDNGRLCGTLFMGNTQGAAEAIRLLEQGASVKEAVGLIPGDQ